MPDYAEYDGRPHVRGGHEDFRYDAWRTLSNPALDYAWFAADPWAVGQGNRVLRFLAAQGPECARSRLSSAAARRTMPGAGLRQSHAIFNSGRSPGNPFSG